MRNATTIAALASASTISAAAIPTGLSQTTDGAVVVGQSAMSSGFQTAESIQTHIRSTGKTRPFPPSYSAMKVADTLYNNKWEKLGIQVATDKWLNDEQNAYLKNNEQEGGGSKQLLKRGMECSKAWGCGDRGCDGKKNCESNCSLANDKAKKKSAHEG